MDMAEVERWQEYVKIRDKRIADLEQDNHVLREQRDIAVRQLSDVQTKNERLRNECAKMALNPSGVKN